MVPEAPMATEPPAPSIWLRPERARVGRPAQRSRAEITAAAVAIADREGLEAVSSRAATGLPTSFRSVSSHARSCAATHGWQQRSAAYLRDAVTSGEHPRLAGLLTQAASAAPADRYRGILTRILAGLLS
jgi:hypothetical protein